MSEPKTESVLVHLEYIRAGIDGLNERMDTLNGRTRSSEQKIAVIEARIEDTKTQGRNYGGAAGAFVGALIVALYQLFGGTK